MTDADRLTRYRAALQAIVTGQPEPCESVFDAISLAQAALDADTAPQAAPGDASAAGLDAYWQQIATGALSNVPYRCSLCATTHTANNGCASRPVAQ